MRKVPVSLLLTPAATPVCTLVACTLAPTMTASDLSTTRPAMDPRGSCASSRADAARKKPTLSVNMKPPFAGGRPAARLSLTQFVRRPVLIGEQPVGRLVIGEAFRAPVPFEQ